MPFVALKSLDPERIKRAEELLCATFGITSLHPYQVEVGQNILRGVSTLLDVPTGGGKTIAFWYALFYYWSPGNTLSDCQKIVLVVGPLIALMEAQARTLNEKGIPAVAITSTSADTEQLLTDLGNNKFRVGFVGPEKALSQEFHDKVCNNVKFTKNVICLALDEGHCISEWGTDDFRPEYREITKLASRLPTGLPIVAASATLPRDVIRDVLHHLGLPADCARVQVSNEKLNVSLSVRLLQNEPSSYADLLTLYPKDPQGPEDFLQSLVYTNGRQDAEKIQDFLRDNAPEAIDKSAFEFYHKEIDDARKKLIERWINSGKIRAASSTDALGLGMDFRAIMRVYIWMMPRTFLSMVQKFGRCVRDITQRGHCVLYLTKAIYTRCVVELETLRRENEAGQSGSDTDDDVDADELPQDRDAAAAFQDASDEEAPRPAKRAKRAKKVLSPMEARDRRYLLEYITTAKCRRLVWNKFFGNKDKKSLDFVVPDGPCCDNCDPEQFPVETIVLVGGQQLKTGRREKSSPELEAAVRAKLEQVREEIIAVHFPNQHFLTGNVILSDDVIHVLAARARLVTSVTSLLEQVRWIFAEKHGPAVVSAIQEILLDFPDLAKAAKEQDDTRRTQKVLDTAALKELRSRLALVFEGCHTAVLAETRLVSSGKGKNKTLVPYQMCKPFLHLPRRDKYPDYRTVVTNPISISNIRTLAQKPTHYQTVAEYRDAWHLMFDNARLYNEPGSAICGDAEHLQKVFDQQLYMRSAEHGLPGYEDLPAELPSRAASSAPPSPPLEDINM